jgi:hypothetical protein
MVVDEHQLHQQQVDIPLSTFNGSPSMDPLVAVNVVRDALKSLESSPL